MRPTSFFLLASLVALAPACDDDGSSESTAGTPANAATADTAPVAQAGEAKDDEDATEAAARAALAAARGETPSAPAQGNTEARTPDTAPSKFAAAAAQQEAPPNGKAAHPAPDQVLQANGEFAGRPLTEAGQAKPRDYDMPPPNAPLYRGGCPKGSCKQDCPKGAICEFDCEGGECIQSCARGSDCNFTCDGGKCSQYAEARASATMWCEGGSCNQVCAAEPGCHRKCGDKCKDTMSKKR